jgi:hypothetical protein
MLGLGLSCSDKANFLIKGKEQTTSNPHGAGAGGGGDGPKDSNSTPPEEAGAGERAGASNPDGGPAASTPAEVTEQLRRCQEARTAGRVKTMTMDFLFPASIECEWDKNGNLSRLDRQVRARREQYLDFVVPQSSLCDIRFTFPSQSMQYDDEIFFIYGDTVVMSSQDYRASKVYPTGLMESDRGFVKYQWAGDDALLGLRYDHRLTPRYCLESIGPKQSPQLCQIPETETAGQIRLAIPSERILELSQVNGLKFDDEHAQSPFKSRFGFVTTGDNDDGDCEHSEFRFQTVIDYIENP